MILATGLALEPGASLNTNAQSVSRQATINDSATTEAATTNPVLHPQLQEQTFKPVTPIKYQMLDKLLQDHPNRKKVDYVVKVFQYGFSLKYNGPRENHQPCNLPTGFSYLEKLWDSVMKEVKLGRMP